MANPDKISTAVEVYGYLREIIRCINDHLVISDGEEDHLHRCSTNLRRWLKEQGLIMMTQYSYRSGGLMRCCIATMELKNEEDRLPVTQGVIINCDHCSSQMVLIDGSWEWVNPEED